MKNFHSLLCSENFRNELAETLTKYVPELLECDPNNHIHDCVKIIEYNNPNGKGYTNCSWFGYQGKNYGHPVHYFSMYLVDKKNSGSVQGLWEIYEESSLDEIPAISIAGCWGFKLREGWVYPNLGDKVQKVIINFIREYKLKRICNITA